MNWKDYEEITKYIYECLGKASGVKVAGYGPSCKVKGKTGIDHQIDILTTHTDGIHTYRTAIECKYWQEKINKDVVMKVAAITEDTGIQKGVIVSRKGFTDDGIKFAQSRGIGLVELREVNDSDKSGEDKIADVPLVTLNINTVLRRPEVLSVGFDITSSEPISGEMNHYQWKVKLESNQEVPFDNYITAFQKMLHQQPPEEIYSKHFELKGATMINFITGERIEISGLTLNGKLTVKNHNRKVELVDKVWLLMKSLFEEKQFSISRNGIISTLK